MRMPMLAAVMAVASGPALASAGVWCSADDATVAFDAEGGLSRSIPSMPFNFRGTLTVRLADAPADLRELTLTPDDLAQSWVEGDEIRLQIYRERTEGPFGSIGLVIKTTMTSEDEMSFDGTYALSIFAFPSEGAENAVEVTGEGKVSCSMG